MIWHEVWVSLTTDAEHRAAQELAFRVGTAPPITEYRFNARFTNRDQAKAEQWWYERHDYSVELRTRRS